MVEVLLALVIFCNYLLWWALAFLALSLYTWALFLNSLVAHPCFHFQWDVSSHICVLCLAKLVSRYIYLLSWVLGCFVFEFGEAPTLAPTRFHKLFTFRAIPKGSHLSTSWISHSTLPSSLSSHLTQGPQILTQPINHSIQEFHTLNVLLHMEDKIAHLPCISWKPCMLHGTAVMWTTPLQDTLEWMNWGHWRQESLVSLSITYCFYPKSFFPREFT